MRDVTPLILTFNEAPNIARCLEHLTWANRTVVLDSGSTDDTVAIAGRFPNVEVHTRRFDDHTSQWNHGLDLVNTPWVLSLDADYVVSEDLIAEILALEPGPGVDAAYSQFRYCVFGRPLRASLYPPRAVLFRRDRCRYEPDGHTQRLRVPGESITLQARIDHDDRKALDRWFVSQNAYARLEAEKLLTTNEPLGLQDRLRKTILLGPSAVAFYTLVLKGTLFDGWRGWYYTAQRVTAETMLSLHLLDRKLRPRH